jgi:hypothetical protein
MTQISGTTRVVEHDQAGNGRDIGAIAEIFPDATFEIGPSQGEDASRGAYDWWPITQDGKAIGELRDDACGLTLHIEA